jgi:glycerol-3-phosphate O-acyltransferase
VFRAILRQVWLRITGKFHRFGYAAVSFGKPLTLSHVAPADSTAEALSATIMTRIADAVPVLPVPLLSHLLLTSGPMPRDALEKAFGQALKRLEDAQVHLPRHNRDYAVEFGLRNLQERGIVVEEAAGLRIASGKEDLAGFYANSVRHLM